MDYNAIVSLVFEARKIALDDSLRSRVDLKGKHDYVTAVDTAISNFIKQGLMKIEPEAAFVTEEESKHSSAPRRFILDPIDGTANLVRGYKKSSISLGYYEDGKTRFGVVYDPFTGETFFSIENNGAYFYDASNGIDALLSVGVENYRENQLRVSAVSHENAVVEFGAGSTHKEVADLAFGIAKKVFCDCQDLRRICSTALALCYIAAGRIDGYYERHIKPWDYAAASLILNEAGGSLSQWNGEPLPFDRTSSILAGNEDTFRYLSALLKSYAE